MNNYEFVILKYVGQSLSGFHIGEVLGFTNDPDTRIVDFYKQDKKGWFTFSKNKNYKKFDVVEI